MRQPYKPEHHFAIQGNNIMLGSFLTNDPDIPMNTEREWQYGINDPASAGDITMNTEREWQNGNTTEIIESQKKTIAICMAQVSHRWHLLKMLHDRILVTERSRGAAGDGRTKSTSKRSREMHPDHH